MIGMNAVIQSPVIVATAAGVRAAVTNAMTATLVEILTRADIFVSLKVLQMDSGEE